MQSSELTSEIRQKEQFILFCHVKNEGPFMLEWIAYHKVIGFDEIVICSNPSSDGTEELLAALASNGEIVHIQTEVSPGQSVHEAAIAKFNESCGYRNGNWYMWLDADEFLNVHVADGRVQDLRSAIGERHGILVNWRIFGSSGHASFHGRFIDVAFSRAASEKRVANLEVKTLFRFGEGIRGFSPKFSHRPLIGQYTALSTHDFISGSGRPLDTESDRNREWLSGRGDKPFHIVDFSEFGWEFAQVNHYAVRTPEMFQLKRLRGRASRPLGAALRTERYKEDFFKRYDKNDVTDTSILRWADATADKAQEMKRIAAVSAAIQQVAVKTRADLISAGYSTLHGASRALPDDAVATRIDVEENDESSRESISAKAAGGRVRPIDRVRSLHRIVKADRKTVVVDVGANPLNGTPVYALLRRSGVARIIGFQPQPDVFKALKESAGPNETYLPLAVGRGSEETLFFTKNSGLVSTLEPDPWIAKYLNRWWERAIEVRSRKRILTQRLDDVAEIGNVDFLKIDIQGGELFALEGGRRKLQGAALIQTAVPLIRYYRGQPALGDVQLELEAQGFLAHRFMEVNAHQLHYPTGMARDLSFKRSQVTAADIAFVRNPTDMSEMPIETLQHMAVLSDSVLQSFDLVFRCLAELVRRGAVTPDEVDQYVDLLKSTGAVVMLK